jgi:hypothetical protein
MDEEREFAHTRIACGATVQEVCRANRRVIYTILRRMDPAAAKISAHARSFPIRQFGRPEALMLTARDAGELTPQAPGIFEDGKGGKVGRVEGR